VSLNDANSPCPKLGDPFLPPHLPCLSLPPAPPGQRHRVRRFLVSRPQSASAHLCCTVRLLLQRSSEFQFICDFLWPLTSISPECVGFCHDEMLLRVVVMSVRSCQTGKVAALASSAILHLQSIFPAAAEFFLTPILLGKRTALIGTLDLSPKLHFGQTARDHPRRFRRGPDTARRTIGELPPLLLRYVCVILTRLSKTSVRAVDQVMSVIVQLPGVPRHSGRWS
jgi:hypothetical protein